MLKGSANMLLCPISGACLSLCYAFAVANAVGMKSSSSSEFTFSFLHFCQKEESEELRSAISNIWTAGLTMHTTLVNECITTSKPRPTIKKVSDYLDADVVFDIATKTQQYPPTKFPWAGYVFTSVMGPDSGTPNINGSFWWIRPSWSEDLGGASASWIETAEIDGVHSIMFLYDTLTQAAVNTVSLRILDDPVYILMTFLQTFLLRIDKVVDPDWDLSTKPDNEIEFQNRLVQLESQPRGGGHFVLVHRFRDEVMCLDTHFMPQLDDQQVNFPLQI